MIELRQTTIRKILKRVFYFFKLDIKIGGPGVIVEIYESKFGKRKYNRGHKVDGVWVVGLVERIEKRLIVLSKVKNRKKKTLINLIKKHVLPGSIIYTNCWKGYIGLEAHGYVHKTVNHSLHFKYPVTGIHTNTIEGNWTAMKKMSQ